MKREFVYMYVPRSTTSGVTGILSRAISGDGTDLSSGVSTLFTPKGGTRDGNAILVLGTWLVEDDLRRRSLSGVPGGEILR